MVALHRARGGIEKDDSVFRSASFGSWRRKKRLAARRHNSGILPPLLKIAGALAPKFLLEHRRRRIALNLLGIPHGGPAAYRRTAQLAAHVERCRFDLWPEFLRRDLGRWSLVDVGANEGEFIDSVSALRPPAAIFAFEPLPELKAVLEQAVAHHGQGRVITAAAGDQVGSLVLNRAHNTKLSSVLEPQPAMDEHYREAISITDRIEVPATTLDAEIPTDVVVGLLKIDVQGFEPRVLDGARQTLSNTAVVMLEINYSKHYSSSGNFEDVHDRLCSAGFRLNAVSCPYISRAVPLWADAVYVSRRFEQQGARA
jgi:FkbM family methyltransferase